MIKKLAILSLVLLGMWLVYRAFQNTMPDPIYNINDRTAFKKIPPIPQLHPVIVQLNAQNATISSVQADRLEIKQNQHRFAKLTGTFAIEKKKRFRMTVQSQLGGEIDIGSNDILFWYWSRLGENGTLFFCKHEDVSKSRLKRPFNPDRLMNSFGYNEIDMTGCELAQHDKYLAVIKPEPKNEKTIRLIDPARPAIIGSYLYDPTGRVIASTEAVKFDPTGKFPIRWLMRWNEEGLSMEMELLNPRFNTPINPAFWKMPSTSRMVDMATD